MTEGCYFGKTYNFLFNLYESGKFGLEDQVGLGFSLRTMMTIENGFKYLFSLKVDDFRDFGKNDLAVLGLLISIRSLKEFIHKGSFQTIKCDPYGRIRFFWLLSNIEAHRNVTADGGPWYGMNDILQGFRFFDMRYMLELQEKMGKEKVNINFQSFIKFVEHKMKVYRNYHELPENHPWIEEYMQDILTITFDDFYELDEEFYNLFQKYYESYL